MINLTNCINTQLSISVQQDNYFMVELENIPFLLALVAEEFIYTDIQLKQLKHDLNIIKGNK